MARRLKNLLFLLPLVVLLFTCVIWNRSYEHPAQITLSKKIYEDDGWVFFRWRRVIVDSGRIALAFEQRGATPAHDFRPVFEDLATYALSDEQGVSPLPHEVPRGNFETILAYLGFGFWRTDYKRGRDCEAATVLVVPMWSLAMVAALSTCWFCVRPLQARFRRRRCRCPDCGYDVRYSQETCPECGSILML